MKNDKLNFMKPKALSFVVAGVLLGGLLGGKAVVSAAQTTDENAIVAEQSVVEVEQHKTSYSLLSNLQTYSKEITSLSADSILDKDIKGVTTSMPSTGDVNVLIFAVDFADAAFDEDIEETLQNNFFGEANEGSYQYPLESLKAFYERSSWGQLSLDGDIERYTSPNNRSYYDDNMDGVVEEAINSLLERLTAEADEAGADADSYINEYLAQYDSNGDFILDGVYLHYAGGTGDWGEQWWSYVGYFNGYTIGDYTFGSTCIFGDCDAYVLIHETGHMLGLGDYYDYDLQSDVMAGIHSLDMMQGNVGDHNAFSKLLLGWIAPENVEIITGDIETVELSEVSEEGQCVVVLPEYDENIGLYTEFFLITYREYVGNNYIPGFNVGEGGLCIYHVNAALDENETGFLYDNASAISSGYMPLIRQVHQDGEVMHSQTSGSSINGSFFPWPFLQDYADESCHFREGDEFSPYSLPSSGFYAGETLQDGREYTGITVNNIMFMDGVAYFDVGVEEELQEYEVKYSVESPAGTGKAITDLRAELTFSTDVSMPEGSLENQLYSLDNVARMQDEEGNVIGYLQINLVNTQNGFVILHDMNSVKDSMESDRVYTIVIPEGTFYDALGNVVGEIEMEYSTCLKYSMVTDWELEVGSQRLGSKCIDEFGNGIYVTCADGISEEYGMTIYRLENYEIVGQIDSDRIREIVVSENTDSSPSGLWKIDDETWGWVTWPNTSNSYYIIFDISGNVLKTENFTVESQVFTGNNCGVGMYQYVGKDYILEFSGEGFEKYPFDIKKYDSEVATLTLIETVSAASDGATAINMYGRKSNGEYFNRIYVLNTNHEIVYSTDSFNTLGDMIESDGKYYLSGALFDAVTCEYVTSVEVLDAEFNLCEKYYLDCASSIRSFVQIKGGFALLTGGDSLYFYDDAFNNLDCMEEIPAVEIYQVYEDRLKIYANDYGKSIDISALEVETENLNVVDLSTVFTLYSDNEIQLAQKQVLSADIEAALDGMDYVLENTDGEYVTTDSVLAVTSDNGLLTKYYRFVYIPVSVTGVALNKSNVELVGIGKTAQLEAMVTPENADNQEVTWTSSDESVATVTSDGEVEAVGEGTCTITVTTVDGEKTASCEVTVTIPIEKDFFIPFTAKYDITNRSFIFDFTLETENDFYLAYYVGYIEDSEYAFPDAEFTESKTASVTLEDYDCVHLFIVDKDKNLVAKAYPEYNGTVYYDSEDLASLVFAEDGPYYWDEEFFESIEFVNGEDFADFDFGTTWEGKGVFTINVPDKRYYTMECLLYRDGEYVSEYTEFYGNDGIGDEEGKYTLNCSWDIEESGTYEIVYWFEGEGVRSKNQYVAAYEYEKPEEKVGPAKDIVWSKSQVGAFSFGLTNPEITGAVDIVLEYKYKDEEEFYESMTIGSLIESERDLEYDFADSLEEEEGYVYRLAIRTYSNDIEAYTHGEWVYSEVYDPSQVQEELTPEEQVRAFVERMYTVALGREAEEGGAVWWTEQLLAGTSDGAGLAEGFLNGGEFKNKGYSDAEYVAVLYDTFFNRPIAEGEGDFWVNGLANGATRESVLYGFVNSEEFFALCDSYGISRGTMLETGIAINSGIGQFAERLYTEVLGRDGEEGGMEYWATSISKEECTPKDAAMSFFTSQEYLAKGTTDEEYLEALYRTFMGRDSDEGGMNFWLSSMANGTDDRASALTSFAASEEFVRIMASYGL